MGYILPPFLVTKKVGSISRLPIFPLFTAFSKVSMAGRDFSLGSWTTNMSAITLPFLQPQNTQLLTSLKLIKLIDHYLSYVIPTIHHVDANKTSVGGVRRESGVNSEYKVPGFPTDHNSYYFTTEPVTWWIFVLPVSKVLYNSLTCFAPSKILSVHIL